MILVAGGTGTLGTKVVGLLRQRGLEVRVLTRDRARAAHLDGSVDVVEGDVGDPTALKRAVAGVQTVVSAIQGFAGPHSTTVARVDRDGNLNLIQAAREAGVEHVVLVSIHGAAADHPIELNRAKYVAEQSLKDSGLAWTIIRPTTSIETWSQLLGRPLLDKGKTQVFGRGQNPINWVSATDVARLAELAIVDPAMRGEVIELGGPENLTVTEFIDVFRSETTAAGAIGHIPRAAMRLMAIVMRLVNPAMAAQVKAGIIMDTGPMAFDASETRRRYPSIPVTRVADVVKRDFTDAPGAAKPSAHTRLA